MEEFFFSHLPVFKKKWRGCYGVRITVFMKWAHELKNLSHDVYTLSNARIEKEI